MPMHMVDDSRPRATPEVRADVEARRIERLAQSRASIGNQLADDSALLAGEKLRRCDVTARSHHQMPIVVGIAIEHDERVAARIQNEAALALRRIELTETENAGVRP